MDAPRIVVNAKVYDEVTGQRRVQRLARACRSVGEQAGVEIGLAPPMVELASLGGAGLDHVVVFAQHVDALAPGKGTGWTTAEAVAAAGARGSLLNHAEHKVPHEDVRAATKRLHDNDLWSLLCADSLDETRALAAMRPTYVAVEPPELIGGDVSVTSADPAIVSDAASVVRDLSPDTRTLCGAGVKTGKDVETAIGLGAYGVLLASGVVLHDDPAAALADLAAGLP